MNYIYNYLESTSHSQRLKKHTLETIKTGKELAKIYGEDIRKVEIACLYHDWAKEWPIEKLNHYILKFMKVNKVYLDKTSSEFLLDNKNISHGKIAAHYLKENWTKELAGINFTQDVIDGISYHTTGRKNMSRLEQIVYLADAIEPNRNYDRVNEIREISKLDLEKACLITLENTYEHLIEKGLDEKRIHKDTIEAINYYREKLM